MTHEYSGHQPPIQSYDKFLREQSREDRRDGDGARRGGPVEAGGAYPVVPRRSLRPADRDARDLQALRPVQVRRGAVRAPGLFDGLHSSLRLLGHLLLARRGRHRRRPALRSHRGCRGHRAGESGVSVLRPGGDLVHPAALQGGDDHTSLPLDPDVLLPHARLLRALLRHLFPGNLGSELDPPFRGGRVQVLPRRRSQARRVEQYAAHFLRAPVHPPACLLLARRGRATPVGHHRLRAGRHRAQRRSGRLLHRVQPHAHLHAVLLGVPHHPGSREDALRRRQLREEGEEAVTHAAEVVTQAVVHRRTRDSPVRRNR